MSIRISRGFHGLISVALVVAELAFISHGLAQGSPDFGDKGIPVPPKQLEPWTAPLTKLAPVVVGAIKYLFDQGLADPRGCDYREIEVPFGQYFAAENLAEPVTKTHGWVLPGSVAQKFAVCWNGVVYPAISVGARADLRDDVEQALRKDEKETDRWKKTAGPSGELRPNFESPYVPEIAFDKIDRLRAALLLRLGEADLAEAVWNQWFTADPNDAIRAPYHFLAQDFATFLFDLAVRAHERGDDQLALARQLDVDQIQAHWNREKAVSSAGP